MSQVLIPVPKTPFLDARTGSVSREWFAFFAGLLQQTNSGGETILVSGSTPVGDGGQVDQSLTQAFEAWSQSSSNSGQIEALLSRFDGLDPQISGPQEFGELAVLMGAMTPFGMAPIETGEMQSAISKLLPAKNEGSRVIAAGHADLIAGTVIVNDANSDSANEWSLTTKVVGGTQGLLSVGAVIANTSFVINSSDPLDTSTVSWVIFAPIGA